MAKRIWKYPLTTNGVVKRITGKLSKILTIDVQNEQPYCWILIDDDVQEISIDLVGIGTGWEIPEEVENMGFVGTLQTGEYVWHYFWKLVDNDQNIVI